MRPIKEHNRLEDNRLQNKGKAPTAFQYQKESRIRRLSTKAQKGGWGPHKGWTSLLKSLFIKSWRRLSMSLISIGLVKWVKIWPSGTRIYCTYHREKGHTTEQCRTLKDYLELLVRAGHLRMYVVSQGSSITGQASGSREGVMPPPLSIIEVIHAALIGVSTSYWRGILSITP